jgi:hypothetical protein
MVADIRRVKECGTRTNGGSLVLWRREIFDWMGPRGAGAGPFQLQACPGKLLNLAYDWFLACMDTFKYKQGLNVRGADAWIG